MRLARQLLVTAVIIGGFLASARPEYARAQGAGAASPRASLLVTPAWLALHLHDPDLVLLHIGDESEYAAAHIAGARLVGLDEISVSDRSGKGLMLEMPSADSLRKDLAALGISDKSHIVVYYGKDRVTPATRVMFTLDYAGLGSRSALLDGGMGAWTRAGNPVTDVVPPLKVGSLAPLHERPLVVSAEYVRAHIGKNGSSIVDARAAVYYDGVQHGSTVGVDHRSGHIPGARNVPFTEITTDQLLLKSPAELEALFTTAGVAPSDTVVAYCHIGQQATGILFAARTLGHPVLLYDGSFQDWSRHADYPVENPAEKKKP